MYSKLNFSDDCVNFNSQVHESMCINGSFRQAEALPLLLNLHLLISLD